ncbi:hypothetical protein ACIHBQ_15470 [Streptomyces sp. NPDC052492]|uniref:hypothetical protein n=1 Tax=Streptomyces sp. NPDC052492 TaxID=3365691 RepID=UPI0037D97D8B
MNAFVRLLTDDAPEGAAASEERGLPVGLRLVAAWHRDALGLRAAHTLYEAGVTLSG